MRALPWRHGWPVAAALVLGALGYLLLGNGPADSARRGDVETAWSLPASPAVDLAAAQALWAERAPWGAAASGKVEEPPPPQALPVGVVVQPDGLEALFALPGEIPVAVREGGALPGGGQLESVSRTEVTWTDASGQSRTHELFVDPLPTQATGGGA